MDRDHQAYQAALDYIYSFVNFSLTHQQNLSPENFDLGRMRAFVTALENPQGCYPVVHVAGTKGKGSVSALCAGALQAAGYRVGLYTSPHLQDFEERIQVDGEPIPRLDLVALVERIKPIVETIPRLTTFEIATALAFVYFAHQVVDVAVLEVGLGGRLDATNVVTPLVSVITSISLDHTYVLGDSLAEIAAEKGGIIKPGVPVVLAPQRAEVSQVVMQIAAERRSPLVQVGRDYLFSAGEYSLDRQSFRVWHSGSDEGEGERLGIRLLGDHQIENAATAYAALQVANEAGMPISRDAIREGFASAVWPARLEVLRRDPPVVIDAAHNHDSIRRLRLALDKYFPEKSVYLVLGFSADKDVHKMLAELLPRVTSVIATQSIHPRAMDANQLAELVRRFDRPVESIPDVAAALEAALGHTGDSGLVLVTGSLFVAAGARLAWSER